MKKHWVIGIIVVVALYYLWTVYSPSTTSNALPAS